MKKYIPLFLALLLLTTAACSNNGASSQPSATPSASSDAQTFTGILSENRGGLITVSAEKDGEEDSGESYVFGTEGITVDAKEGDKVTVTYTGDLNDIDSSLEATKVEVVK